MKKLLFFTVLFASVNICLPAETSAPTDPKKLTEEANKKWQDEDIKLAKQALQNKVNQLRKCAKDNSKSADEQIRCVLALEALRELLLNPKQEITDLEAKIELSRFIEDGSKPTTRKLNRIFQGADLTGIV